LKRRWRLRAAFRAVRRRSAALSTSGLRGLRLPDKAGHLTIATGGDAPRREAGNVLASRMAALGGRVSLLPAPEGRDWADILTGKREAAA